MSTTNKIEKLQKKLTWISTALAEALTAAGEIGVELAIAEAAVDVAVTERKARTKASSGENGNFDEEVYQAICDKDEPVSRGDLGDDTRLSASLGRLKAAGRITMTGVKRGARYTVSHDTDRPAADDGIEKFTAPANADPFESAAAQ